MIRNMVFLMHDCFMWPTTHAGCPVTHHNVSRVLGIAPKIFARKVTLKTIVHWQTDWGRPGRRDNPVFGDSARK